jgi:hypothetical protein
MQMKGHGKKLPHKQEEILSALLIQPNMESAADAAKVSISTVRRYMQLPEFKKQYLEARRQILDFAIKSLQHITSMAVEALLRNLTCGNPNIEVKAAIVIINQSLKATELLDLENRIDILEKLLRIK